MYQVSILVPIYGVEKYIERCARSLFEQTYGNLEYIFVDDCTPDKSIDILERVMEDYPNRKEQVRIIRHERNRGLAAARNTALDAATSPFVTHVDSDDYLSLDAVQLLVEKQVETGADIVSGNYYVIESNGARKVFEPDYADQHDMMRKVISPCFNNYAIWHRIIRRSLYNDHHIRALEGVDYNEDLQQFIPLVYYARKIAKINDHIYFYDRTNIDSYVSNLFRSNESLLQSIASILYVDDFISNAKQEYKFLSHRAAIRFLKMRMSLAAKHRKKIIFETIKRTITSDYADSFDAIGWEKPLVRAFMCNYTLNGVYRRSFAHCQQIVAFLRVK